MRKRGPRSKEENDFIAQNYDKISAEDIAKYLNRDPIAIKKHIDATYDNPFGEDIRIAEKGLKGSPVWQDLKQQFDIDELKRFEHHYTRITSQFKHDVYPTEEIQIIDACKLEILMNRALTLQKKSMDDIVSFESMLEAERRKEDQDFERIHHLERQVATLRAAQDSLFSEYKAMQEQKMKILKDMKATRDQRIKVLEGNTNTFRGWLRNVLENRELRAKIGLAAEKMRLAALKEKERLSEWHKYEDGQLDQPLLTAENILDE